MNLKSKHQRYRQIKRIISIHSQLITGTHFMRTFKIILTICNGGIYKFLAFRINQNIYIASHFI